MSNIAIAEGSGITNKLRITKTFFMRAIHADEQCGPGESWFKVNKDVRDDTHYIKLSTGKANKRSATPCTLSRTEVPADGKTPVKLSQMRDDTHVQIRGPVSAEATMSGTDSITFSVPGQYTLIATAPFPAMPREVTINAT